MEEYEDEPRIPVRGALMILALRMMIDDDTESTGVVKKYYISKEEAQRRIDILKKYPHNDAYSDSEFREIYKKEL